MDPIGILSKLGKVYKAAKAADDVTEAAKLEQAISKLGLTAFETSPMSTRIVQAPKEVSVGRTFKTGDKKNIIRGTEGFGGISPQKLPKMFKEYTQKMEDGAAGRMWYDESSKDIMRWVGGDPAKADDMANMLATTSANTPVNSNLMYSNKGWNQRLVGDPIKTGQFPNDMGRQIDKILANPATVELGLKRSPFSAGLSVDWRGPGFANRPTHDIHDVRAWGIKDPKTGKDWEKGVPDAGHRFLDSLSDVVTNRANENELAGFNDWNPYRGQAAAWIAQKAAKEGVPIDAAARHYGSFAPEYQAMITREYGPGSNTGHLLGYEASAPEVKKEFADALEALVTGRKGIDKLASESGALVDRTVPNLGYYEGETSPGFASLVNVGKAKSSQDMDPASMKVADAIASMHGLLGVQKQVGHNYSGNIVSPSKAGSLIFKGDPMGEEALARFYDNITDLGKKAGITSGDVVPMVNPQGGARALMFGSPAQNADLTSMVSPRGKFADRWMKDLAGLTVEPHASSGNLIPFEAPAKWSAKPFIAAIEASGPEMEKNASKALQRVAPDYLRTVEEHSAKNDWLSAPFYKPMMEGLAEGGLPRLKELVKQGVVPAAVFTAVDDLRAPPDLGTP